MIMIGGVPCDASRWEGAPPRRIAEPSLAECAVFTARHERFCAPLIDDAQKRSAPQSPWEDRDPQKAGVTLWPAFS